MIKKTVEDLVAYGLTELEAKMLLAPVKSIPKDRRVEVMAVLDKLHTVLIPMHNKAYVQRQHDLLPESARAEYKQMNKSYFE